MNPHVRTYDAATVKASVFTPFVVYIINALVLRVVDLARQTHYTQSTQAHMCKSSMIQVVQYLISTQDASNTHRGKGQQRTLILKFMI